MRRNLTYKDLLTHHDRFAFVKNVGGGFSVSDSKGSVYGNCTKHTKDAYIKRAKLNKRFIYCRECKKEINANVRYCIKCINITLNHT